MGFLDRNKIKQGDRVIYGSHASGYGEKFGIAISDENSCGDVDIKLDNGQVLWSVPPASFRKE